MSGWTTLMPARPDRSYRLNAWTKGGKLAANGFLAGGAVQIEFLDNEDRVLGKEAVSPTVGPEQDWSELATPAVQPPPGAARMRLTAGLRYCNGTAWLDDLRLESTPAAVVGQALVKRIPAADPGVRYAANLLANPGVEDGEGDKPARWTFVGLSNPDWSEAAIATFHREGRPHFDLGRARPGWSRDQAYAGNGALLLESIDPPLSKHSLWYGRNQVDGFWLSDPMPCTAGGRYLAGAWVNPGAAITMQGFRSRGGAKDDIAMVNEHLQPRPQFAAHTVMADALADATFVADRSRGQLTCGEWTRGDGPLLVLWPNAGNQAVTLEVPRGALTVMDMMGNHHELRAMDGVAVLAIGTEPVYCFAGGALAFSTRIELQIAHGTVRADRPQVHLRLRNNQGAPAVVRLAMTGPLAEAPPPELTIPARGESVLDVPVRNDLDGGRRTPFSATATTLSGAVFAADAALNLACAVRAGAAVPLDGTWSGPWAAAPRIRFGSGPGELTPPSVPGESHTGADDVSGTLRLLWDDHCLYLGVEAADDLQFPQTVRNGQGFMGDSIEFAVQPDSWRSPGPRSASPPPRSARS